MVFVVIGDGYFVLGWWVFYVVFVVVLVFVVIVFGFLGLVVV